ADRADISEEVTRLRAHLAQFVAVIEEPESAGRKLEFIVQEMGRETNTIGSKANDVAISRDVGESKGVLEKIRERSQNAEEGEARPCGSRDGASCPATSSWCRGPRGRARAPWSDASATIRGSVSNCRCRPRRGSPGPGRRTGGITSSWMTRASRPCARGESF